MAKPVVLSAWRQRVACAAALMMFYLAIVLMKHHEERPHLDRIPSIAVFDATPMSNIANSTASYSAPVLLNAGLVLPESSLHRLYISVG
ncbi:MAG: hypothetical protein WCB05_12290 [Candidatus Sulfotelmatobacter sp.]